MGGRAGGRRKIGVRELEGREEGGEMKEGGRWGGMRED